MAEVAFRDYLNEIDKLIERGSTEQAMQHCRHILAQHPKAVEVYRLLGKALLEQEDDPAAQDVFQRVLSVDPEDFVARVGLSVIHDRNNELERAIWHMERAFEIAPSNALIQGELRRLYARRDGDSPERIPLTRGALARMYAAGDLNSEAIADLRQLLSEQADRFDLQVQLAEVLWRDEQRVGAAEYTQQLTSVLPYCLKANLILGAILRASGATSESDEPLQRAQAADPENQYAHRLFSGMGPLYQQSVMVDHLELLTIDQMLEAPLPLAEVEEVPEWLRGLSDLEKPLLEEPESMEAARLAPGLHVPDVVGEVPDWLQGLTGEAGAAAEAEVPDWLVALTGAAAVGVAAEELSDRKHEPTEAVIQPADETVPDWIAQLGQTGAVKPTEELPVQEEEPAWLAQLRETPPAPFSEQIPASVDTETPDWLAQLQAPEPGMEAEPVVGEEPDWLSQLRVTSGEVESKEDAGLDLDVAKAAAGVAGLAGAGAALFATAHEAGEEKGEPTLKPEQPINLAQPSDLLVAGTEQPPSIDVTAAAIAPEVPEELPSNEDALAFLAKLAAGKEDQLRAQAQEEADVRMAEIMGRKPAQAAPVAEDKQAPIKMMVSAASVAAVAAGLAAITPEEKPAEPEPAAVPEELPGAAGKDEQLRAQAEQEAEARMAEIMGATAIAAGVAASKKEEPPIEVPEEMPSADDALAFLTRLAAGKEDELRAQAEREAEARMAAIMGRSAPLEPTEPITEEVTEIPESAAEADLPDWLKTMRPAEPTAVETPESELPEWLQALHPAGESAGLGGEVEEAPLTPEFLAGLAALELAIARAEATSTAQPTERQSSAVLPPDWWVQTATDTDEEPLSELPQPYLSPRARAAEKEKLAAAALVSTEVKPLERKRPQTGPLRQTGPLALPQTGPLGTPEPAAVSAEVETLLSRVYQDEQDYAARLDLARTYWATGNREGAYGEYSALVNVGEYMKETMADLETIVEIHDQTDWHRMLGDAYMKVGRLSSALEHYRHALSEI